MFTKLATSGALLATLASAIPQAVSVSSDAKAVGPVVSVNTAQKFQVYVRSPGPLSFAVNIC